MHEPSHPHRVVIVGGGFGGLAVARALRKAPVEVTVLDRRNFHVFQPLLYQVATGGLSPADIATAHRWILRRQENARVLLAEVAGFDPAKREVLLTDGAVPYDTLILAAGAEPSYFGHDEWAAHAPGLKTLEDGTEIRRRIYLAFEAAEREPDPARRAEWLTFAVVGAGPTGVELAGAIVEIARHTLRQEFRAMDPAAARVVLLDAAERVLPVYPPDLSDKCARSLARLGVEVRTGTRIEHIDAEGVRVRAGADEERIPARTVLWAAGVRANPLGRRLADTLGVSTDRMGRIPVEPDLSVPGHPDVFVIGDLALCTGADGAPLPGVAPVAMQQGRYAGRLIYARLAGRQSGPFRYVNKGELATIGRAAAVANFGRLRFSGYPAWLLWLFVHLMYLVDFENRLLVFVQWAWNYVTWNRGARLIAHGWNAVKREP
jgi:NADH:ubiquinone reductase (H+-translocating)